MTTLRDLIEQAREIGFRDVADTMDIMVETGEVFDLDASEQPVSGETALVFRTGVILGYELAVRQTPASRPNAREKFLESLREKEKRRLADAFEYCWSRPQEVEDTDFDPGMLPLGPEEQTVFGLGLSFGMSYGRTENS